MSRKSSKTTVETNVKIYHQKSVSKSFFCFGFFLHTSQCSFKMKCLIWIKSMNNFLVLPVEKWQILRQFLRLWYWSDGHLIMMRSDLCLQIATKEWPLKHLHFAHCIEIELFCPKEQFPTSCALAFALLGSKLKRVGTKIAILMHLLCAFPI